MKFNLENVPCDKRDEFVRELETSIKHEINMNLRFFASTGRKCFLERNERLNKFRQDVREQTKRNTRYAN